MSELRAQAGSPSAVRVEGLSKRYLLGETHASPLSSRIAGLPRRLLGKSPKPAAQSTEFWALQDISFELARGDALGIVGGNGAGKSTLLKILSRITPPTSGRAHVRGRLASLLEVGTGFHPELTGRDNVYLNGTILGMRHAEIARKFDEIVAFSGVERFIDTPIKRYSSGMHVRLAFAVAAHLEPDVLILDEVLAVGDAEFQRRCLGKMSDVAREGRTVIFVSHNLAAVRNLCNRGLFLKDGRIAATGEVGKVVDTYMMEVDSELAHGTPSQPGRLFTAPANESATSTRVLSIDMLDAKKQPVATVPTWETFTLRVAFHAGQKYPSFGVEFLIFMRDGALLARGSTSPDQTLTFGVEPGNYVIDCEVKRVGLAEGEYLLGVALTVPKHHRVWRHDHVAVLRVVASDIHGSGSPPVAKRGPIALDYRWSAPVAGGDAP